MDKKETTKKIAEALKKTPKKKFTQSIEVIINFTDIDMENTDNKLNTTVVLPKGRGKDIQIGAFAEGDMKVKAKKILKHVLDRGQLEELGKNKRKMRTHAQKCYTFIAQPDLMPAIGKTWGIVLGPRGKMPQPVPPNADLKTVVDRLKNTVKIRSKKNPTIHVPVGVETMSPEDILANISAVNTTIERQIPKENIKSVYIKTTMGEATRLW